MTRLGILAGSSFLGENLALDAALETVSTPHGPVPLLVGETFVFLPRHGPGMLESPAASAHRAHHGGAPTGGPGTGGYRPPHRIPHHAHALALAALGVRRAVGLYSVGGLRSDFVPGTVVIPDDYLSLHPPPTFVEDERRHLVPILDPGLRARLSRLALRTDAVVRDGGVYAETRGPRFETRAEVRFLGHHAHVVGMTGASEATLLQEQDIAFAMLAIVDNLAHGVGESPLSMAAYEERRQANGTLARSLFRGVVDAASSLAADWPATGEAGE
jgi:purine nucleoside phosphorylase